MSMTLPEYLFSRVLPGKSPISKWSPPVEDAELAGAGHLVAEAHAARAEDAALRVQDDVGAERHRLGLVHLLVDHRGS
jgi:hypothetical protein